MTTNYPDKNYKIFFQSVGGKRAAFAAPEDHVNPQSPPTTSQMGTKRKRTTNALTEDYFDAFSEQTDKLSMI